MKKRFYFSPLVLIAVLVLSGGCTYSQKLRSPQGQEVECKVFYYGFGGAILATMAVEDCSQRLQKRGYTPIKERVEKK